MRSLFCTTNEATGRFTIPGAWGFHFAPASKNLAVIGSYSVPATWTAPESHPGMYPLGVRLNGKPESLLVNGPHVYRFPRPFDFAEVVGEGRYDCWRVTLLDEGDVYWPGPLVPQWASGDQYYAMTSGLAVPNMDPPLYGNGFGWPVRGYRSYELVCQSNSHQAYEVDLWVLNNGLKWTIGEVLGVTDYVGTFYREVGTGHVSARVWALPRTAGVTMGAFLTYMFLG